MPRKSRYPCLDAASRGNKRRLIGQKCLLMPKDVWTIRIRLQLEGRKRDLVMFDLAVDSKLRGCDLIRLKMDDVSTGGTVRDRATVIQKKTGDRFGSKSPSKPEALSEVGCPTSVAEEVSTCSRAVSGTSSTSRRASTRASSTDG